MTTPNYLATGGVISGDYRYELTRDWADGPECTFVMLSPSTADAHADDPTIRRCVGFATSLGCGSLRVVNLYAIRATDPKIALSHPGRVGPENDYWLQCAALDSREDDAPIIAGWGVNAEPWRVDQVLTLPGMERLTCLGVTKDGHPRHPLYVRGSERPVPWRPAAVFHG